MFESTFEKCLIQLSVELIQPDIPCHSMNHTQHRIESALPRVETNIFQKLIQTSENIWIWGLFFFQCIYTRFIYSHFAYITHVYSHCIIAPCLQYKKARKKRRPRPRIYNSVREFKRAHNSLKYNQPMADKIKEP